MAQVNRLVQAGLLLAVLLVIQSLRSLLPFPPFFSTLLIGIFVNAVFLIAIERLRFLTVAVLAVIAPIVAYLQQLLILPIFIPLVAIGNVIYVFIYSQLKDKSRWSALIFGAFLKTCWLFGSFFFLLQALRLPSAVTQSLLFVMSWPQFITGIGGGLIAWMIIDKIKQVYLK